MSWLQHKAWAWAYSLEEMRQQARIDGDVLAEGLAALGLVVLNWWGC